MQLKFLASNTIMHGRNYASLLSAYFRIGQIKLVKVFVLLLLCGHYAVAQNNTNPTSFMLKPPDIIQHTPEAAGLGRFGDIPVGEYTGVPSVSIPLYTVKSGDIEVPMSLSYHTTGIQVSQEATWVGLGWDLFAGGIVNTIVVGHNDQVGVSLTAPWYPDWQHMIYYNGFFPYNFPHRFFEDYLHCTYERSCPEVTTCDCSNDSISNTPDRLIGASLLGDAERDIYSFNFLDRSFKVVIHPKNDSIVFVGERNKCKITKNTVDDSWTVIDEKGITYRFMSYDMTMSTDGSGSVISSWYLDSIVDPDRRHYVKFNYISRGEQSLSIYNESLTWGNPSLVPLRKRSFPVIGSHSYLASIETENEIVSFKTSVRTDGNFLKLDTFLVTSKLNNNSIMSYKFNYDYFIGSLIGGDYLNDGNLFIDDSSVPAGYKQKRLKLNSLVKLNGPQAQTYRFGYNDSIPLPYKTSFAMDYWGYYNGQDNYLAALGHHSLIPNMADLCLNDSTLLFSPEVTEAAISPWAIRAADPSYITAGVLKNITYPTGGKTTFEVEPNTFNNYNYPSVEKRSDYIKMKDYFIQKNNYPPSDAMYPPQQFTLTKSTTIELRFQIHGPDYVFDSFNGAFVEIHSIPGMNTVVNISISSLFNDQRSQYNVSNSLGFDNFYLLPAGDYLLVAFLPGSITNIPFNFRNNLTAELNYTEINIPKVKFGVGGGVRIKKITNYDYNNNVLSTKSFKYLNEDGTTSGQLIAPLSFLKTRSVFIFRGPDPDPPYVPDDHTVANYISTSSITSLSNSSKGNTVGNSRVEVYNEANGQAINGKEIYYFDNQPAQVFFDDFSSLENTGNGNLLKKVVVNSNNDTIKLLKNEYLEAEMAVEHINVKIDDCWFGPIPEPCIPRESGRFVITTYPNRNYWTYLSKTTETSYFGSNKAVKTTNYIYNPNNYQLSETDETGSDGHTYTSMLKYPNDFPTDPIYTKMVKEGNIIAPLVQQSRAKDGTFIDLIRTNYFIWPLLGNIIKPISVEEQIGSGNPFTRIAYDNYDQRCNPQYIIKDGTGTVYLWSYNYQYPVAKIEGLTYAEVVNALTQTFINNLSTTFIPTTNQLNTIRTGLSSTSGMVTTYAYSPLIGMTSSTDPNGITTYYIYDTFGRLTDIKDKDGNVLKHYEYNYAH